MDLLIILSQKSEAKLQTYSHSHDLFGKRRIPLIAIQ